jgi:uncharacterized membrane protein (TIGR02234 family)
VIRTGQLMLVLAAIGLWVAARLSWVTVTSADGLGQPKTTTLSGGTWSNALIPLAVLLLAAAIAGLAVHGWGLRVVAVLVAVVSAVLGYLAVSLVVLPDVSPRAIELAQVPVTALVASQRHYVGPGLTAGAAILALLAAVLLIRSAGSARHTAAKYAAPAARRRAARTGDRVSERGMWDAIDEGRDPTENETEGR